LAELGGGGDLTEIGGIRQRKVASIKLSISFVALGRRDYVGVQGRRYFQDH
jgi:hypothetical protein